MVFPGGASGTESSCQCRGYKRHWFHPWLGKIPWKSKNLEDYLWRSHRGAGWATVHGGQSWTQLSTYHLKYHLQLKTKNMLDGEKPLGKYVRQSTVNKGTVVMQIWVSAFSISKSFYTFTHPFLPGLKRETHLQTEIPLINANISYRRLTSQFSELLPSLLFLKITSLPLKLEV